MRVFFDSKPYNTISVQVNLSVGWRHENPRYRGVLMESLSDLKDKISTALPRWFEIERFVDAEYSGIRIFGTQGFTRPLEIVKILDANLPNRLVELGGGIESVAISGALKKKDLKALFEFKPIHRPGRSRVGFKPRGFVAARELSRFEKIFIVFSVVRRGGEIFLEVSRNGSRIHYGKKSPHSHLDSMDTEIKRFELYLLKKRESTSESVKFLSLLNVYSKDTLTFQDALDGLRSFRIPEIVEILTKLEDLIRRKIKR